jgi:hypothetical protein
MGKEKRRERRDLQQKQKKEQKRKRTFKEMLPPDWDILAVIVLLALVLRMWFALSYDATLYDQAGEGVRYIGQVGGEPIDSVSPPLYILFLRICLGLFGHGAAQAAFVVKGIIGTISVVLIYYIAREISDRTVAVISAAISAIYVNYMMASLALSPRVPGIFALLIVTFILIKADEGKKGNGLAGAVLGLGIMIDPYLLLFAPGFLLVSRGRKIFLGALFAVLLPWTLRNSAREGMPVPVYATAALELDITRWMVGSLEDFYHLVDKLYINGSNLISRGAGWVEPPGSTTSDNIRNSTTFGAYFYMVMALSGVVGLLRYHSKKHRALLYPVLIYLAILVLFSTTRNTNRLIAEHIAIFYTAVLLPCIIGWFRNRFSRTALPDLSE